MIPDQPSYPMQQLRESGSGGLAKNILPSSGGGNGCGSAFAEAGANVLAQLMDDYLRPGQQILSQVQHEAPDARNSNLPMSSGSAKGASSEDAAPPRAQGLRNTGNGNGPAGEYDAHQANSAAGSASCASSAQISGDATKSNEEEDDVDIEEEARKGGNKRTRDTVYTNLNTALSATPGAPGTAAAAAGAQASTKNCSKLRPGYGSIHGQMRLLDSWLHQVPALHGHMQHVSCTAPVQLSC
jgi:hypothetical protein